MDLVQLSNVFNKLTEKHPILQHYHFGWPEEVNQNTANNFDRGFEHGNQYPLILFLPPDGNINIKGDHTTINVDLYFYDLQGRQNDGTKRDVTLLEQFRDLQREALKWLSAISEKPLRRHMSIDQEKGVQFELMSNQNNDKLILMTVKLDLFINSWECPSLENLEFSVDEMDGLLNGKKDLERVG